MSKLLSIDPVAFIIFGLEIRWYAIFITSALVVCLVLASLEARRRGVNTDIVLELFIWCVPIAVVMARIFYVLSHPESYFPLHDSSDWFELINIRHGGLTIIGAIFGALIGAIIVCRLRKKNFLEIVDFGVPFLLLGQALGRWGNFINQEAYGKVVASEFFKRFPLGVFIDYTAKWHYATFFYEMVLNFIGFIVLYMVGRKTRKRGVIAAMYFVWYGIVRGLMEFIREDAVIVNGAYITQVGCFIAACIGIIIISMIQLKIINTGTSNMLLPDRINEAISTDTKITTQEFNEKEEEEEKAKK